jgi:hypothetical protein
MASNLMEKAERAFKKEEQRREGAKNMSDYEQSLAAEQKKTERLRAMRLAHETQQAEAQADVSAAKPKAASRKKSATKKARAVH